MSFIIPYPLINGHRYSHASAEIFLNGIPFPGITSISYSDELESQDVYGTDPQKLGRTRGKRQSTIEIEMLRLEWEILKLSLGIAGVGYGETPFLVVVGYSEGPTVPVTTDYVEGVRVSKAEVSSTEGNESSKVKLTCSCIGVNLGGMPIASPIALTG